MFLTDIDKEFSALGFVVLPSFISDAEQSDLLGFLERSLTGSADDANLSIAQRNFARKAGNIVAVNEQRYGREYYMQTDSFMRAILEKDGCYTRLPSDSIKHAIPKDAPRIENPKNILIKLLGERIRSLPIINHQELYLVQCVHYNGEYERGKHIDNKVNGGDIIVGCSLGPTDRYIELSGNYNLNFSCN